MSGSIVARSLRAETANRVLFYDLDLTVGPQTRLGVVGANGSGKSTLLSILAGQREAPGGHVERQPLDVSVGLLCQEPDRSATEAGTAWLRRVTGVAAAEAAFAAAAVGLADESSESADRYDVALHRWSRLGCADFEARLGEVADELDLDSQLLQQPTETLSGERQLVWR